MNTKTLMIQGTTSDAGKSTLVAGLCRYLAKRGWRVAPMKPQNMALNSAVTADGGEIGRAQAVQAQACGLEPGTDMNPVLLKPSSDTGAQIIINGKALSNMEAQDYHAYKATAMQAVIDAHQRLQDKYDAVIVEGAGSPAEINLRDNDIANMGFAEAVDCPVLIVADIDKGGVFAHLVGTLELLSPSEQQRVAGFIINRFRGDIRLLQPGLDWLEEYTGKPVLGVLPFLENLYLESEDAINLHQPETGDSFRVTVPVLPRISNHTDFDSLQQHPAIELEFTRDPQQFNGADLLIIPGSKNVCHDRQWLHDSGWEDIILRHLRYGGKVLGICGGFQMLGRHIHDPKQIEGSYGCEGLGLLDFETRLEEDKTLVNRRGRLVFGQTPVTGYEIHVGRSEGPALASPLVTADNYSDGVISADGLIAGTYLHGLFDEPGACNAILEWAGLNSNEAPDMHALRERELVRLANSMQEHLDMDKIESLLKTGDRND